MRSDTELVQRALILDDNPMALLTIESMLASACTNITVETERSYLEAQKRLNEAKNTNSPFEFFLTDLQFGDSPVEDGINMIRETKLAHPNLKIIAISGKDAEGSPVMAAGAFAFFRKPEYDRLVETVRLSGEILEFERKLKESTGYIFKDIMETLPVGISIVDWRMKVLYINETQKRMSELKGDLSQNDWGLCYEVFADGATDACPGCPVVEALRDTSGESKTTTHMRGKSRGYHHKLTAIPVVENGKVIAALKVAVDVTSREEFETFRKGLDGELTLERRISMILNAVASRGYKRARMLLITNDGKSLESYAFSQGSLDNFGGKLEPLDGNLTVSDVLREREPIVFTQTDLSKMPCWQVIDTTDIRDGIQYGLVPMTYRGKTIGAVYVDNREPSYGDPDITRTPISIRKDRLHDLLGFAEEGAKAIVESKNMEMARHALKILEVDRQVLQQWGKPGLLQTLVDKCVELIIEQKKKSVPELLLERVTIIHGEVWMIDGTRLIQKTRHPYSFQFAHQGWHLENDTDVPLVQAFRKESDLCYNDVQGEEGWDKFRHLVQHKDWAIPAHSDYLETIRSYACFPLKAEHDTMGILCLESAIPHFFDDTTLNIVRTFVGRTIVRSR